MYAHLGQKGSVLGDNLCKLYLHMNVFREKVTFSQNCTSFDVKVTVTKPVLLLTKCHLTWGYLDQFYIRMQ